MNEIGIRTVAKKMSTQRQHVTIRDLAEEAKKRIVVLVICVVGLSYLMSYELLFFIETRQWRMLAIIVSFISKFYYSKLKGYICARNCSTISIVFLHDAALRY
uniref:Uncharacterized protein n=1 Tax=Fagus sylvatica TaxID=28930 RepID=A0A2N9EYB0_FAGSY